MKSIESETIVRYYSFLAILINVIAAIFFMLAYFGFSALNLARSILFLVAFFTNLGLILVNFQCANREDPSVGRWVKNLTWLYLFVLFGAVLMIGISQIGYLMADAPPYNLPQMMIDLLGLFGNLAVMGFGALLALYNMINLNKYNAWVV